MLRVRGSGERKKLGGKGEIGYADRIIWEGLVVAIGCSPHGKAVFAVFELGHYGSKNFRN